MLLANHGKYTSDMFMELSSCTIVERICVKKVHNLIIYIYIILVLLLNKHIYTCKMLHEL